MRKQFDCTVIVLRKQRIIIDESSDGTGFVKKKGKRRNQGVLQRLGVNPFLAFSVFFSSPNQGQ